MDICLSFFVKFSNKYWKIAFNIEITKLIAIERPYLTKGNCPFFSLRLVWKLFKKSIIKKHIAIIMIEKIYMNKIRTALSQEETCKFSKMTSSGSGASSTEIFLFKKKFFLLFLLTQQQQQKYFKFFIFIQKLIIVFLG